MEYGEMDIFCAKKVQCVCECVVKQKSKKSGKRFSHIFNSSNNYVSLVQRTSYAMLVYTLTLTVDKFLLHPSLWAFADRGDSNEFILFSWFRTSYRWSNFPGLL